MNISAAETSALMRAGSAMVHALCGLMAGDVGTAVLVHGDGAAYEVEFVGYDGHTVALLTLERNQLRPLANRDIPHARELASA